MKRTMLCALLLGVAALAGRGAGAQTFFFSTGNPDGLMAMGSRPASAGVLEIEAADDFIVTAPQTNIHEATFVGLLSGGTAADINQVAVEMYRVFPQDSDTTRTPNVPTRVNSPSDVAFATRDSAAGELTFTTTILASDFTASNSVLNGIHPSPGQHTGGDGAVRGQEVLISVKFTTPFGLPADHYFFVPQTGMSTGNFLWLSAPTPIVPPGTPFAPDLQTWIRNANLDPDWLRVGTDIVGAGTFNGAFSVTGAVPEPGPLSMLLGLGMPALGLVIRRRFARR